MDKPRPSVPTPPPHHAVAELADTSSQGAIARRLFDLALPVIGLNVLAVLALAIDTAMCGRLENADDVLTALGFSTQVIFLLMVFMIGLTVGTVAMVGRAHGAGNAERVNHLLSQATMLTVLVGMTVAVVGNLLAPSILGILGAEGEVLRLGLRYLRPLLYGTVLYYLTILYAAILRGVGVTRLPFLVALGATAVNVFCNYGMILGNMGFPALGVRGAAYGTVISQAFSVIVMVALLRRGAVDGIFLSFKPKAIDLEMARDTIRIGAPAALDMVILNVSFMSVVGMLGRIETVAVAAHGVGLRIQSLAFVPGMSVSQATGAMVGQALGANKPLDARKVVRASIVMSTAIMTSLAIVIVLGVHPIVSIFNVAEGTRLHELTVLWIRVLGVGMPIVGLWIGFVGMLQGSGATNTSLAINVLSTVVVQIPLSLVLGFSLGLGAFGVWVALPVAFGVKALFGVLAYRFSNWDTPGEKV